MELTATRRSGAGMSPADIWSAARRRDSERGLAAAWRFGVGISPAGGAATVGGASPSGGRTVGGVGWDVRCAARAIGSIHPCVRTPYSEHFRFG